MRIGPADRTNAAAGAGDAAGRRIGPTPQRVPGMRRADGLETHRAGDPKRGEPPSGTGVHLDSSASMRSDIAAHTA